jgi:hypothetical protein
MTNPKNQLITVSLISITLIGIIIAVANSRIKINKINQITQSHAEALQYPPDTKLTQLTVPVVARPDYLAPILDPTFKTQITRITDQTAFKDTYKAIRHNYAKNQPWNADGSLIMISYEYNVHILDGKTYKYIKDINLGNMQPIWSNTNPTIIFARGVNSSYTENNQFIKIDVNTGEKTILHTFTEYDFVSIGEEEGNVSNDDQYVVLMAKKGTSTYSIMYNIQTDTVVSVWNMNGKWPDWVAVSQSGQYILVNWNTDGPSRYQGIEVYDQNFNFLRQAVVYGSHADMGYDVNGNEVLVSFASGIANASIIATRLDGVGRIIVIDKSPGFWAGHISCRNLNRPGWCYLSHAESNTGIVGYDETFAVKLDGSQTVERFAHEHHVPLSQYYEEPMAVPSRDGYKVLFSSNWDGGSVVYDYIAEMALTTSLTSIATPIATVLATPTPLPTVIYQPLDTIAPSITILSPLNNSLLSRNSKVLLSADVRDTNAIGKVEFIVNGSVKCTDSSTPYNCSWRVPNSRATNYSIEVRATDVANNKSTSSISVTSN